MNKPKARAKGKEQPLESAAVPPPIRLVHAFKEASQSSKPESDDSDEALAVELLLIAGRAAFEALSRLDELSHQTVYGEGKPNGSVDRVVVEEGYLSWLKASEPLVERMARLERIGYESESIPLFRTACTEACSILDEALDRKQLEQQALRADQLANLAAKLRARRTNDGVRRAEG